MSHTHAGAHAYAERPHPEFVVLEIGEGVGALIVHTDPDMHGVEVEISPSVDDTRRSHKEVLERSIGSRPAYTAVFDRLPEGSYTLWTAGVPRARGVAVAGGQITQLSWADSPEHR
jgi:hypothetical protein